MESHLPQEGSSTAPQSSHNVANEKQPSKGPFNADLAWIRETLEQLEQLNISKPHVFPPSSRNPQGTSYYDSVALDAPNPRLKEVDGQKEVDYQQSKQYWEEYNTHFEPRETTLEDTRELLFRCLRLNVFDIRQYGLTMTRHKLISEDFRSLLPSPLYLEYWQADGIFGYSAGIFPDYTEFIEKCERYSESQYRHTLMGQLMRS
ncbi:uncharacterized protein F4822DRAFT_430110 [Hypoxylon trugodes]|uniref:uncharacterized protein n=1 Tax=Hypoxylon trugodes TaxID=326681 RepID=UPI002190F655|nr:uncharacterized protein F4822DRAFT_430110 [Hypoxylon trugodes]KAI1387358.1 hypothetical protein F4822DRAFT_430110 [Hypoxylon trugodes]